MNYRPTNIFDYYAPVGSSSKIADYGIALKKINASSKKSLFYNKMDSSKIFTTTKKISDELSKMGSIDMLGHTGESELSANNNKNTWIYFLIGTAIVGGIAYYYFRKIKKKDETH